MATMAMKARASTAYTDRDSSGEVLWGRAFDIRMGSTAAGSTITEEGDKEDKSTMHLGAR